MSQAPTAEEVMRRMLAETLGVLREQLAATQAEFQKIAGADLDLIDEKTLPALLESASKFGKATYLPALQMLAVMVDACTKERA